MAMLESVGRRIHADFLMRDRLDEYWDLLVRARDGGYQIASIGAFWEFCRQGSHPAKRWLLLRHDIDSDPATARQFFGIEQAFHVRASYFFRLGTLDVDLMQAVSDAGGDVGYHYEELSTLAKECKLYSRDAVNESMPAIRARFRENLLDIRRRSGLPIGIIASHGDFVNRALGMPNHELLDDSLRRTLHIELEAYDTEFESRLTSRFADGLSGWTPENPVGAIDRKDSVVLLLTHPRWWRRNSWANLRDDVSRVVEGFAYRHKDAWIR